MRLSAALALALSAIIASTACGAAQRLTMEAVNEAQLEGRGQARDAALLKLQVLLDRAHASPGQIDGKLGENTRKAIEAYRRMSGLQPGSDMDRELSDRLGEDTNPVLVAYKISEADVAGPFIEELPEDYREKANLERLAFTGALELLAERFHMSETLLKWLNPEASFDQPGTEIVVANVARHDLRAVSRVEIDGREQRVLAFGGDRMIAAYPATVGSAERPSPTGEFKVTAIAKDPVYHYDPKNDLRGVRVEEKLKIPPGPNNPVGTVWIDLSAKSYGIHGTPEPDKVSRAASHGCIRLTNWDAEELAKHVRKGTPVLISGKPPTQGRLRR